MDDPVGQEVEDDPVQAQVEEQVEVESSRPERERCLSARLGLFRIQMVRMVEHSNVDNLAMAAKINRLQSMVNERDRPNRRLRTPLNDEVLARRVVEDELGAEDGSTTCQVCLMKAIYLSAFFNDF